MRFDPANLPAWAVFLLCLGLALRATRLVVKDSITEPFRNWVGRLGYGKDATLGHLKRRYAFRWFYKLITCPWCTGFWASVGAFAWAYHDGGATWFWASMAASASYLLGFVSMVEYRIEGED